MTLVSEYRFTVDLTKLDYARMSIHTWSRSKLFWSLSLTATAAVHVFIRLSTNDLDNPPAMRSEFFVWIMTAIAFVGIIALMGVRIFVQLLLFADSSLFDEIDFNIADDQLRIQSSNANSDVSWSLFRLVRTTKRYCYLYVSPYSAYIIPRRCLPVDSDWDKFCAFCKGQAQLAKAHADQ